MYDFDQETIGTEDKTDRPEPPADAEHFVLFHQELADARAGVVYEPGDELPADLATRVWSAFNDRIAVYGEYGRRLDTPTPAETDMDTSGLQEWARETAVATPAESHVCETCNKVFPTEASLHGHQSKHAEGSPATKGEPETVDDPDDAPDDPDDESAAADVTDVTVAADVEEA